MGNHQPDSSSVQDTPLLTILGNVTMSYLVITFSTSSTTYTSVLTISEDSSLLISHSSFAPDSSTSTHSMSNTITTHSLVGSLFTLSSSSSSLALDSTSISHFYLSNHDFSLISFEATTSSSSSTTIALKLTDTNITSITHDNYVAALLTLPEYASASFTRSSFSSISSRDVDGLFMLIEGTLTMSDCEFFGDISDTQLASEIMNGRELNEGMTINTVAGNTDSSICRWNSSMVRVNGSSAFLTSYTSSFVNSSYGALSVYHGAEFFGEGTVFKNNNPGLRSIPPCVSSVTLSRNIESRKTI